MILSQSNTLTQDIDAARKEGYNSDFYFRNGKINCRGTNDTYGHESCFLVEYCRHEGMTDPGDASILFLIQCGDGRKGYLSSAYGIYANTDLIDFIHSLKKLNDSK
ncbi:MAG: hypothetical protein WBM98_14635 [Maribacter sp.]|uniref:hypothetical protein n=1 Tax=Maribacter sp. TaxID=1897614 RepID=UPI003C774A74